jgi:CheY-like chemotaxis protein
VQPAGAVLIADDEPYIRKMIGAFLQKHKIPVFEASTGREAIERIKTHGSAIRAVVLDVAMPEMRGDQALTAILDLQPDIQIIVSSGYSEADISRHFAGARIRSFLPKPFTKDQLLEHVLPALGVVMTI